MPIIRGLIESSAGTLVSLGRITVQLRQQLIDRSTTPDALMTTLAESYIVTNGVLNSPANAGTTLGQISLPATVNELVSYRFTIERAITVTTWYLNNSAEYPDDAPRVLNLSIWYTGAVFVAGESKQITPVVRTTYEAIVDPFDAILPNVTDIELVDLVDFGAEFVSNPQAGLSYLAQLITTDTQYLNKLRAGRWVGPYSPAVVYQFGDIVSFGSPSQGWISKTASASTKISPPSSGQTGNADWDYAPLVNVTNPSVNLSGLVQKAGDTMTGNLILPAPGGSPPNTVALRQAEADNLYARLAATAQTIQGVKTFTGGVIVPNRTAGEATTNAANTDFVTTGIANYWNANRYDRMVVFAARSANQSLTFAAFNKVTWDSIVTNLNEAGGVCLDGAGVFTIRVTGWHRIMVAVESTSAGGSAGGVLRLQQTTAPVTSFKLIQIGSTGSTATLFGQAMINFASGSQFEIQYQPNFGGTPYNIVGDVNTTRVFVFRQQV